MNAQKNEEEVNNGERETKKEKSVCLGKNFLTWKQMIGWVIFEELFF